MLKNVLLKLIEGTLVAVCWVFATIIEITIDIGKIAATIAEVTVFIGVIFAVHELLKYWHLPAIFIMIVRFAVFALASIMLALWKPERARQLFNLKGGTR